MKNIDERYMNDALFHNLVNTLFNLIEHGNFTPTEIREACLLAQIKYEEISPRHTILSKDLERFINFQCCKTEQQESRGEDDDN